MGILDLLDGGARKDAAEKLQNQIMQALSEKQILKDLVGTISEKAEEEPWIIKCQGYYDTRKRRITIGPDVLEITWSDDRIEKDSQGNTHTVEAIRERVGYSNTKSGYVPLHAYYNAKGKEEISTGGVVFLWASIVREHLQAKFPECTFEKVERNGEYSVFTYTVPALIWEDWF